MMRTRRGKRKQTGGRGGKREKRRRSAGGESIQDHNIQERKSAKRGKISED